MSKETDRNRKDFDEESIASVEKANEVIQAVNKEAEAEPRKLMRHGTYTVENCGDSFSLACYLQ